MALMFGMASCDDFLDRPDEGSYNGSNFYQNDTQVKNGVNSLYNSPWYGYLEGGYYEIAEVMSGNIYKGGDHFHELSVTGSDMTNTSESLWSVIAQASSIYNAVSASSVTQSVKNTAMGECLAWKAMAYFCLVRMFGDIPIVHNVSAEIESGDYNNKYKVQVADVYEYIIMTLEKAIELLPESNDEGRVDRWGAKGLLAKVYLTKSGINCNGNGSRDTDDLAKAASYAKDVIDNSGKQLMENYADVFKGENECCEESLFGLRWTAYADDYTTGSPLESWLAMKGFDVTCLSWGDWTAPSVDLQDAFGVSALDDPSKRTSEKDTRRKATMMMAGDKYDYWWQDQGGFDYIRFLYDSDYAPGSENGLQSATGSNIAKHMYGNDADHERIWGVASVKQNSALDTHMLRLSDVYLVYAEAVIGNGGSTSDAGAIDAYYAVRSRAIKDAERPTSITLDDVLKERRLELAFEGDYWFDLVRMSYYNLEGAMNTLKNQRRSCYYNLGELYKGYYTDKKWEYDENTVKYATDIIQPTVRSTVFTLPFPDSDILYNHHLMEDPIHVDVRAEYSY